MTDRLSHSETSPGSAIDAVAAVIQLRGKRWAWTPPLSVRKDLAARMIAAYLSYLRRRSR